MNKLALITLAGLAFLAAEAQAQMGGGGMGGGMGGGERPEFAALDTDENGSLSTEELSAFNPDRAEAIMGRMDSDQSGSISQEEWAARQQGGGGGGGMGMGQ